MLETFNLKKSLDVTRQQLSLALYQHDAACRVIARVVKERDEARARGGGPRGADEGCGDDRLDDGKEKKHGNSVSGCAVRI